MTATGDLSNLKDWAHRGRHARRVETTPAQGSRRFEKVNGKTYNVEFATVWAVKLPLHGAKE
jgi:hypothetical protein